MVVVAVVEVADKCDLKIWRFQSLTMAATGICRPRGVAVRTSTGGRVLVFFLLKTASIQGSQAAG